MVIDADEGINSQLSFSLENNTGNVFTISAPDPSSTGVYTATLSLTQPLDYETLDFYRLTVTVEDGGSPTHSAAAIVEVEVHDVIDNPPVFSGSEYITDVPENTAIGTTVFTLNATTVDSIGVISYHINSFSPPDFKFSLDLTSGAISVHNELDYEQEVRYLLSVRAQTAPGLETSVIVIIDIVNVNDNSPDFIYPAYNREVTEGALAPHTVVTVRATDDDSGSFGAVRYYMASNNSNITNTFRLNETTGEIVTLRILDYETRNEYSFDVGARDGGTPARYDQVSVTVRVTNVNDERPVFLSLTHNVTVTEEAGAGVLVARVEAVDDDSPLLEYSLASHELRSLFAVDLASGHVTTRDSLDREVSASYTLEVSASDGQLQSQENAVVYVTVVDINDRSPLFPASGYSVELSELAPVNGTVVTVQAFDRDEGTNSQVTYTSPTLPQKFSIAPESGVITLEEPLDFEEREYYSFLVWANDGGDSSLSSSTNVEITVVDENDNAPEFLPGSRSGRVRENSDALVRVLHLSASDRDSGSNGDLEYSIVSDGSAMEAFFIDAEGVIKTQRSLDREVRSTYHLTVEVRDKGRVQLSSTTQVDIAIEDVIDSPPRFESIGYFKEISTDVSALTPLLRVRATTEDDVPPSSLLYSFGSGVNRTLFRINQLSGVISTATNIEPRRHRGRYSFRVTAQHHHLSATTTVLIDILEDTTTPRLKPLTLYLNVFASLLTPTTRLGAVTLEREHEEPVTFSLASPRADIHQYFSVDPASGTVAVADSVRRGHYELDILATSSLGVGRGVVEVYVHTVSNVTLSGTVVVEFQSGSEIHFVSVVMESFAASLTEILQCTREQVEILGIQEESQNGRLVVAFAIRETDLLGYVPREVILDKLRANEGSPRLVTVASYGSELCTDEPCPNFQQCRPVVHIHPLSSKQAYKVLQSPERVHVSHPFSTSVACHCPAGYDLKDHCSVEVDLCTPSPCRFGAPCRSLHNDYVCDCPAHTAGKNCSLVCPSPSCTPCRPDRCLHSSACIESSDLTSYTCDSCPWPQGYSGSNCELTSVHISRDGFLAFPSLGSAVKISISLSFATVYPDGVLLYSGRVSGSHDTLSLQLVRGQVRVTLTLGDPDELITMTTTSQHALNDGEWHAVGILLEGHQRVSAGIKLATYASIARDGSGLA